MKKIGNNILMFVVFATLLAVVRRTVDKAGDFLNKGGNELYADSAYSDKHQANDSKPFDIKLNDSKPFDIKLLSNKIIDKK